jgi:DNA modification methylase
MQKYEVFNIDCMQHMKSMSDNSVDTVITDIPYDEVNRENSGIEQLKNVDKGDADIITFDLIEFLKEVTRIAKNNIVIFCGCGQVSYIWNFFTGLPKGTARQIIWEKTNPVPVNGKHIYLSGIENAVWYKKPGGTFNAFCKNTVLRHPIQSDQIHPTEKNHNLLAELIEDNTNIGDTVFDPCMGSGSTGYVAIGLNRKFIGCELNTEFFNRAKARLDGVPYVKEAVVTETKTDLW